MNLKTLLKRPPITADESMSIEDARGLMQRHNLTCLPVLRAKELVGMITDLDCAAAGPSSVPELRRHDWRDAATRLRVGEAMSREPIALSPDASVAKAARLARTNGVDAIALVEGGELLGVVTRRDLLAFLGGLLEHRDPTGLGHILVATSLNSGPAGALGAALSLAETTGAALTALHVLPRISLRLSMGGATTDQVLAVEGARRRMSHEALAARCHTGRVRQVSCEVVDGPVAQEIARRAAELDSDLIVLGRSSRGLWQGLAGRGIADQVTGLASCPVLVIPRDQGNDHASQ